MTAMVAIACVGAAAPAARGAHRGDTARHSAGVRWDLIPTAAVASGATLRVDRAFVTDGRSGGFVNQMLWVQTNRVGARNEKDVAYGGRRRPPYIAAGITVIGRDSPTGFVAQRTVGGGYVEKRVRAGVRYGKPLGVTIECSVTLGCDGPDDKGANDAWTVSFSSIKGKSLRVHGAGDRAGSVAFYAGFEASSPDSAAGGAVGNLQYLFSNLGGTMGYGGWNSLDKRFTPYPAHRGKASARWTDKYHSFVDQLG